MPWNGQAMTHCKNKESVQSLKLGFFPALFIVTVVKANLNQGEYLTANVPIYGLYITHPKYQMKKG